MLRAKGELPNQKELPLLGKEEQSEQPPFPAFYHHKRVLLQFHLTQTSKAEKPTEMTEKREEKQGLPIVATQQEQLQFTVTWSANTKAFTTE